MEHRKKWSSKDPGCLIVMLDQSGSMREEFGGTELGEGKKKCDMVATVLNRVLDEFIRTNTKPATGEVRPRADVAVLGYGDGTVRSCLSLPEPLSQKDLVTLAELQENPLRLEDRIQQAVDEDGRVYDELVQTTVWVDPVSNGDTPMCAAFRRAREIVERWVADHPENFPPIVITVTDGASSDGDPTEEVQALRRVRTSDGEVLLFNCHITERSDWPVEFVSSEDELPDDPYARLLFSLSSPIPDSLRDEFFHAARQKLAPGTRGYIFNGDAVSVSKMLKFGSTIGRTPFVAAERVG